MSVAFSGPNTTSIFQFSSAPTCQSSEFLTASTHCAEHGGYCYTIVRNGSHWKSCCYRPLAKPLLIFPHIWRSMKVATTTLQRSPLGSELPLARRPTNCCSGPFMSLDTKGGELPFAAAALALGRSHESYRSL